MAATSPTKSEEKKSFTNSLKWRSSTQESFSETVASKTEKASGTDSAVSTKKSVENVGKRGSLEKRESLKEIGNRGDLVQKRFISTWKLACDKTKDRTKELLRRWRPIHEIDDHSETDEPQHNWSVHVWTTWVKRYPSEDEDAFESDSKPPGETLTEVQIIKLTHFFTHVYDSDHDEVISLQDFESFTERVRHFTDWTINSGELLVLQQVQQGFFDAFIRDLPEHEGTPKDISKRVLTIDQWLSRWGQILKGVKNIQDLPIWLQYFPKIIFQAINKSCSGKITRDELCSFYSSVMGYSPSQVSDILDKAYGAMTANGDCYLTFHVYRLCFANFLLGRFPNGPGQFVFGCVLDVPSLFPVDYSAMNSTPEDREQYTPDKKTNRRTVE